MTQDSSAQRQNELLRELLDLHASRAEQLETLETTLDKNQSRLSAQYGSQRQQLARQNLIQKDNKESEYQAELVNVREAIAIQIRTVKNEFDEKLAAARKHVKTAKSDGEYDWFLSKQRLKKEYEADRLATQESYKKFKGKLKSHGAVFNELASQSKAALSAHRCPFKVQGGDLLEDPGDGDHLADHLRTHSQIQELTRQFHRSFWVRFQEDRWFLIAFLVGMVAAAYPLHLWLNNFAFSGVAAAIVGLLSSIVSYFTSRALATKTANQFRPTFIETIAGGKRQLLAAQHQNKKQRDAQLARLLADTNTRAEELDRDAAT